MNPAYRIAVAQAQDEPASAAFHAWLLPPDEAVWCSFHREGGGYRLRFPELADFLVAADGRTVEAIPVPGLDAPTLAHLYHNQVLPLALSQQGEPVFHASAVALPQGAVAFVAESGRGKSTLATRFALDGAPLLTDDGLQLRAEGGQLLACPSHASVRLWEDSREALVGERLQAAPAVQYTSKARLLAGDALPFARTAAPLRRAYFLGAGESEDIRIERMGAAEAALEWVRHSFLLDIEHKPRLAAHFGQITQLAALGLSYRLDYPRDYDSLPAVCRAIRQHLSSEATP